ncbi:MAG: hypothetical protein ABEH81_12420 [Halopenitus sp.]
MYGLGDEAELASYQDASMKRIRYTIENFLDRNPRKSVRFKSVVVRRDPVQLFRELDQKFNSSTVTITEHQDHFQVDVDRKIKQSGRRVRGSFAFFEHEDSQIWTALTGHASDFFERGLEWVIRKCKPHLYEFYATGRDLEHVLDRFSKSFDHHAEIRVTQAVAYSHQDQAEISYKKRPYATVFRKARNGGNYVDSLSFRTRTEEQTVMQAALTRDGTTKLSGGNVELFFNRLLEQYISYGDKKAELFTGKERNRTTGDVEEIEIQFDHPVFQSPKDNEDLIEALADLGQANVTVYHSNPYAHVSVLDFNDGSSCDVFVTDPETVSIVPSYRGSTSFLMRISEKLYRELDESTVEYIEERSLGVEDFLEA